MEAIKKIVKVILKITFGDYRNLVTLGDIWIYLDTIKNIKNDLSSEFEVALKQMKYGKTLPEVLKDIKKKVPSPTINNIILSITESSIFGSSIIETLHNQVEYLREKKILETKEKISKMPIKVSILSVIFFLPIILMLVLGPLLINMLAR